MLLSLMKTYGIFLLGPMQHQRKPLLLAREYAEVIPIHLALKHFADDLSKSDIQVPFNCELHIANDEEE